MMKRIDNGALIDFWGGLNTEDIIGSVGADDGRESRTQIGPLGERLVPHRRLGERANRGGGGNWLGRIPPSPSTARLRHGRRLSTALRLARLVEPRELPTTKE